MHKPTSHPTSADAPERLRECLECGSTALEERFDEETFEYGGREKPFTVTARIPSLLCTACGHRFYDDAAQWARHEAACRHLGVMTPDEIRELRKRYGLTQAALAELTGLGVASLGRWERGAGIQNEACDALLYLLTLPENVERLRRRHQTGDPPTTEQDPNLGLTGAHALDAAESHDILQANSAEEFPWALPAEEPSESHDSLQANSDSLQANSDMIQQLEDMLQRLESRRQDMLQRLKSPRPLEATRSFNLAKPVNRLPDRFRHADLNEANRQAPVFQLTRSKNQPTPSKN